MTIQQDAAAILAELANHAEFETVENQALAHALDIPPVDVSKRTAVGSTHG